MATIGARLEVIEPGRTVVVIDHQSPLTQQHGFLHGGVVGMIADTAAGYAAFSLMPADAAVLTVEYKINFVAPAEGVRFEAEGRVRKPGRTLSVCDMEVVAVAADGRRQTIAVGVATMMCLAGKPDENYGQSDVGKERA